MPDQSPINIALVIEQLGHGGAETQLIALARQIHQQPERFSVYVYCLSEDLPRIGALKEHGIEVEVVPRRGRLGPISRIRPLIKLFKRHRIQVAHCWLPTADLWGKLAAWRAGVPVIIHGERIAQPPELRWNRWLQRCLRGKVSCFVGNSEAVRDMLLRTGLGIEQRTRVIYNGIDISAWQPEVDREAKRRELGLDAERPAVVMVGRLVAQKNVSCLIESASILLKEKSGLAQFAVAGDGPLQESLEEQIRDLGLEDDFKLLGVRRDVPEVLAVCDIAVLCSFGEGLPNAVIESMAAGLPIVGTDVVGTNEVIEDDVTGILVPSDDSKALASAVGGLIDDPERCRRLSSTALDMLRERFSMEKMAEAYMSLYEELLQ